MKKTVKKDFLEYLKGLEEKEKVRIREEFLTMTGLSYPTWYGKISGNGKFSRLELIALGYICKAKFVDD